MNSQKDYYKILNIPSSATDEEITDAFNRAAAECAPDKYSGSNPAFKNRIEEMLKEITEAYEVLSKKRNEYDKTYSLAEQTETRNIQQNGPYTRNIEADEAFAPSVSLEPNPDFDKTYDLTIEEDDLEKVTELTLKIIPPITPKTPYPIKMFLLLGYNYDDDITLCDVKFTLNILEYNIKVHRPIIYTDKEKIELPLVPPITVKEGRETLYNVNIPWDLDGILAVVKAEKATFRLFGYTDKVDIMLSEENLYHIKRFYKEKMREKIILFGIKIANEDAAAQANED